MTGIEEKQKTEMEQAIFHWWERLKENPGARAGLRRARSPNEILLQPVYYQLLSRVKEEGETEQRHWNLPLVAGLLSHVKSYDPAHPMARAMSEKVKDLRFRRLLRVEDREDLYLMMIRMIRLMEGRVDVYDLIRSMLWWNDRTRRRWAEEYYLTTTK